MRTLSHTLLERKGEFNIEFHCKYLETDYDSHAFSNCICADVPGIFYSSHAAVYQDGRIRASSSAGRIFYGTGERGDDLPDKKSSASFNVNHWRSWRIV